MSLHVESRIQFRSDLYEKRNKTEWYSEVGKELEKRRLSITVAPGVVISNAAQLQAFMKRYASDKAGLQAAIALPPGTTLANYVQDLVQALDDTVKPTSVVTDKMIDMGPVSEFGKLLGLDTSKRYAGTNTAIGQASADAVFNVGGVEVSRTATGVDPLAGQLFIDSKTFGGMPGYSWSRDGVELEQVSGVTGVTGKALDAALRSRNGAGRTVYQRLRKPEACEAYTVGYGGVGLDDMRWDSAAHRQREANKFVSLTVEGGRYEAPAAGQPREITLGTDKMDDTYYDTKDFALMKADFQVRGRARWDTDTQIRRLLVGVKSNTVIDEFGLKRSGKVDVRNDGASAEEIKNLDHDVRVGATTWNGSTSPIAPLKGVYDAVRSSLPNIGPHEGVLQLEPKVHLRSVRSRYHLNETSLESLQTFYRQTTGKLDSVLALATAAQATATGADKQVVDELVSKATALKNGSAIATLAEAKLKALDPAMTVTADSIKPFMPSTAVSWNRPPIDAATLAKKQVVAEAIDAAYHQFSTDLDGARRIIAGAQDRALENHPPYYLAYLKTNHPALLNKNTYDPFLAQLDATLARPEADQLAALKAFNDFGEKQKTDGVRAFRDFTPIADLAGFKALRAQLLNEVVRVNQRQLEAGGSAAQGLWFDEARQFYVPSSYRNTGNFLIDTMDMTQYVTHADWESIAADQRTPANELPADKVFHTSLVNETQIELGIEEPYLNRLTELENLIHGDRASLVMKFFDASGTAGIDRTKPETYAAALKTMLGKSSAEVADELAKLNDFLKAQNSALTPVTAKDLSFTKPEQFTLAARDAAVRTTPTLEKNLEGAKFVFQQYIDIQKAVVGSKEDRVLRTLRDAGLNNLGWQQTEDSKGNTALKMVKAGVP